MDEFSLLADSCSGFLAPMQLLVISILIFINYGWLLYLYIHNSDHNII